MCLLRLLKLLTLVTLLLAVENSATRVADCILNMGIASSSSSSPAAQLEALLAGNWRKTKSVETVKVVNYVWVIENFSQLETHLLRSPLFSNDGEPRPKWQLELYPKGKDEKSKGWLSIFLRLDNEFKETTAEFKISILNAKNEPIHTICGVKKFAENHLCWGWRRFIHHRDPLLCKLPNDRLSILCEISKVVDRVDVAGFPVPKFRLSEDFGALLGQSLFADCVLCVDGQEFKAHKAVLACRSPVFAAMFSNDTEERQTGRVNISDVKAPVLSQLLHFVYTGEAPKLLAEEGMAEGLLVAADKYQLLRLKAICEQQLCASLSESFFYSQLLCEQQLCLAMSKESAQDMLALADFYSAPQLKAQATEYISRAQTK